MMTVSRTPRQKIQNFGGASSQRAGGRRGTTISDSGTIPTTPTPAEREIGMYSSGSSSRESRSGKSSRKSSSGSSSIRNMSRKVVLVVEVAGKVVVVGVVAGKVAEETVVAGKVAGKVAGVRVKVEVWENRQTYPGRSGGCV